MTIDEIMKLAFNYAVAFEIHGRNQEADGLSAKQDYAEKTLRAAIEQCVKEERAIMHSECLAAIGLLMLEELKNGADEKTIDAIDACSIAVVHLSNENSRYRCNQMAARQLATKEILGILKEELKMTAAKFADKFQSDLDNYVAAHKLEWSDSDEAVRATLETVIKELREGE